MLLTGLGVFDKIASHAGAHLLFHALLVDLRPDFFVHGLDVERHEHKRIGLVFHKIAENILYAVVYNHRCTEVLNGKLSAGYLIRVVHGQAVNKHVLPVELGH